VTAGAQEARLHTRKAMAIDDKLEKALDNLIKESRLNIGQEVILTVIAAIPHAGGAISAILSGELHRRVFQRAVEMFEAMAEHLKNVDADKIDKDFFDSEEFQTLLALALQQLETTHDKAKLEMLARGLANSGTVQFSSDVRKELYTRILRDLSPNHIKVLRKLLPSPNPVYPRVRPTISQPSGEDLAILQNLTANGLVKDFLKPVGKLSGPPLGGWSISGAERAVNKALSESPSRYFEISDFGLDFLTYFGQSTVPGGDAR
jgi:hypothetical protein